MNLGNAQAKVLEAIKKHSVNGECTASNTKLFFDTDCSFSSVNKSIKSLEKLGIISRETVGRKRIIRLVEL